MLSPPIPRSYKLREDKLDETDDSLTRFSPAKKRPGSPSGGEGEGDMDGEGDESPNSTGKRKRKRELDILMEDKKVNNCYALMQ